MSARDLLSGRRILVTGATGTIGTAISECLSSAGACVVAAGRDRARIDDLLSRLAGGPHTALSLDVTDEDAWRSSAALIAPDGRLDGVVTAAGVVAPIGPVGTYSVRDFRAALDVNVAGTLLAITTALPGLKAARGAIVTLSGGGATGPFARFDAYAASKAAVVRLTENLAVTLADDGIRANAVAPGFIVSAMHNETIHAGPEAAGADYYERTQRALEGDGGDSPVPAAELTSFLLSGDSAGITGKLISAIWDPWRDEGFRNRLRCERDLATLRRIDDQFFVAKA